MARPGWRQVEPQACDWSIFTFAISHCVDIRNGESGYWAFLDERKRKLIMTYGEGSTNVIPDGLASTDVLHTYLAVARIQETPRSVPRRWPNDCNRDHQTDGTVREVGHEADGTVLEVVLVDSPDAARAELARRCH